MKISYPTPELEIGFSDTDKTVALRTTLDGSKFEGEWGECGEGSIRSHSEFSESSENFRSCDSECTTAKAVIKLLVSLVCSSDQ